MDKSNKTVSADPIQSSQEFTAAFTKGKRWLNSEAWVPVANQFRAMAEAVRNMQVRFAKLSIVVYCVLIVVVFTAL